MLLEFNIENYRSIAEKQTLSLLPSAVGRKSGKFINNMKHIKVPSAYAVSAIFGANGSGKSNVIKALGDIASFPIWSAKDSTLGDELNFEPFAFDQISKGKPTITEISFIAGKSSNLYRFGYAHNKERILEEWLYYTPNESKSRQREVYTREWDEESHAYVYSNSNLKGEREFWQKATRQNSLYLSAALVAGADNELLTDVHNWIRHYFNVVSSISGVGESFTVSEAKDETNKKRILSLLNSLDIPIQDFTSRELPLEDTLPKGMPPSLKKMILKLGTSTKDNNVQKVYTLYPSDNGELIPLDLEEESTGTRYLFGLAGPLLDVLDNGKCVVIDELHATIHPAALKFIVNLFSNKKTNPKGAQLIFASHDVSIMDMIGKEQIWFAERGKSLRSKLFPLSDFGLKSLKDFKKLYMAGRFGGVPILNIMKFEDSFDDIKA